MSVQTKKRFKNLGKIIGIVLFAFLMFTNIKIALLDDAEIASGDISVLGVELTLFEATYGEISVGDATCWDYGCDDGTSEELCAVFLSGDGIGGGSGYTYCYYWEFW